MTAVTEIVEQAFRECGLKSVHAHITRDEWDEALARLNTIVSSTISNEVGNNFTDWKVGDHGETYEGPNPANLQSQEDRPPPNSRIIWTVTAADTIYFPPNPRAGSRMAFVDPFNLAATYNATLDGNGRTIVGAATVVLSTNAAKEYMYRDDTGNWVLTSTLTGADEMPFPAEFDDYFITQLAARLDSRWGARMSAETAMVAQRAKSRIRSRYRQTGDMPLEYGLIFNSRRRWTGTGTDTFNKGY